MVVTTSLTGPVLSMISTTASIVSSRALTICDNAMIVETRK